MKALRLMNGSARVTPVQRKDTRESEICLIDYAHCPSHDICWLVDIGSGCDSQDSCFIDTN